MRREGAEEGIMCAGGGEEGGRWCAEGVDLRHNRKKVEHLRFFVLFLSKQVFWGFDREFVKA